MRFILVVLLITASIEGAVALSWDSVLTLEDRCSTESLGVCAESVMWLSDTPWKR